VIKSKPTVIKFDSKADMDAYDQSILDEMKNMFEEFDE
jgi:hypothetical protein